MGQTGRQAGRQEARKETGIVNDAAKKRVTQQEAHPRNPPSAS